MVLDTSSRSRSRAFSLLFVVLAVAGLGLAAAAVPNAIRADPLSLADVPEPLRPWVPWVLYEQDARRCPFLSGQSDKLPRICSWPASLRLELDDHGGEFSQIWRIHARSSVPLVGDDPHWPEDVRVDGKPVSVLDQGGTPRVELDPGTRVIAGRFAWAQLPELLQIPAATGLLELTLNGQKVPFPNRDAQGRLWLQQRAVTGAGVASRIEVVVVRHAIDDSPFVLETRIELRVSGAAREVLLGRALPEGFIPMSLQSPLPARLDPDGRLRVQVRPGTWVLELSARHAGPVNALTLPRQPESGGEDQADAVGSWDRDEVWAFEARPSLRVVEVSGAAPVDPTQTTLPPAWNQLPSYRMGPETILSLTEKRRGDSDPAPDALNLTRTWWLDFDGGGFTVRDEISGVVRRSSRLEMGEGVELGRAALEGRDQVITKIEGSTLRGIEIPRGPIQLTADSRVEGRDDLSAVGWAHGFDSLDGVLNLPPGWRLFHASGVDRAVETWINQWSLLDLFVVLVVAMATLRLFGLAAGLLALVALTLSFPESGAPHWSFIAVLAGEALVRTRAEGNFGRAAHLLRGLAACVLVLIAIPFCIDQVRVGLHPALEYRGMHVASVRPSTPETRAQLELSATANPARMKQQQAPEMDRVTAFSAEALAGTGGFASSPSSGSGVGSYSYAPDPNASVTTGPGLPSWSWNQVSLHWSGPVERAQALSFVLIPPSLNLILALFRVALLAALIVRLLWVFRVRVFRARVGGSGPGRAIMTGLSALLAASLISLPGSARADLPTPELLTELQARLLANPDCFPNCASSPRLWLEARRDRLELRIEVLVSARSAIALPGNATSWTPTRVQVDGRPADALLRDAQGSLWVELEPGQHQLSLGGPLPMQDSVDLPLPLRPHHVTAKAEGWALHGVHDDGQADANIQLTRIHEGPDLVGSQELRPAEFPPFVRVTRNLHLDLDWKLETEVVRETPTDVAVVLEIPLLPGESITTEGVRVEGGRALVTLAPGESRRSWRSVLEIEPELRLTAPDSLAWAESWRLDVGSIWHVEATGIPSIHQAGTLGDRVREWRPWPGETVVLSVTRPVGVEGPTLTIDSSQLQLEPGLRSTEAQLELSIRSSRGGQHRIRLPAEAVLGEITIDGVVQPMRQEEGEIALPIRPGRQQVVVQWREPQGIADHFVYRSPVVDLGMASVNHQVEISPSAGRWILLAGGPRLGPSVLIWPLLGVMAVLAYALGRLRQTPLRSGHWLLLFIGLTQAPIVAAAIPVVWLHALHWREASSAERSKATFDLVQIGLVVLSLSALAVLFFSIQQGLLGTPEMQIAGNGSDSHVLRWYQDRIAAIPPSCWVLSVPLLVYRLAMLFWALWIAQALVGWLRWGWSCFSHGEIWRPIREPRKSS